MRSLFRCFLHLAPHKGCLTQLPTGTHARGLKAQLKFRAQRLTNSVQLGSIRSPLSSVEQSHQEGSCRICGPRTKA